MVRIRSGLLDLDDLQTRTVAKSAQATGLEGAGDAALLDQLGTVACPSPSLLSLCVITPA